MDKAVPYPGSQPDLNPADQYRNIITTALVDVTGLPAEKVYPALQWQNNLNSGDLLLAVPRLQVKGQKADVLAKQWGDAVRRSRSLQILTRSRLDLPPYLVCNGLLVFR